MQRKQELMCVGPVTILGKLGKGRADQGKVWTPPLWEAANRDFTQIAPYALTLEDGLPLALWGAMSDAQQWLAPWGEEGLYLAGCQVKPDSPTPPGWTRWELPQQRYLIERVTQPEYDNVFTLTLHGLPAQGLRLASAVQERYDPRAPECLQLLFPAEPI